MGILNQFLGAVFGKECDCPDCGAEHAIETYVGIRCVNEECRWFDRRWARRHHVHFTVKGEPIDAEKAYPSSYWEEWGPPGYFNPVTGKVSAKGEGTYPVRFECTLGLEYINFQGEHKVFKVDRYDIEDRGKTIRVRVEPTGGYIFLSKEWILNIDVFDQIHGLTKGGGHTYRTSRHALPSSQRLYIRAERGTQAEVPGFLRRGLAYAAGPPPMELSGHHRTNHNDRQE